MKTRQAGMSILESVLGLTLFSLLSVSGLSIWRFTSTQTLKDATLAQLTLQANQLLDEIASDVKSAVYCEARTVGANTVLLVARPGNGTDLNGDGLKDIFSPTSATAEAALRSLPGEYAWYGMADSGWDLSGTPAQFTRIVSSRDKLPTNPLTTLDLAFNREKRSGSDSGLPRHRFVESISFNVDPLARQVTITLVVSNRYRNRTGARDTTVNGTDVARITLVRAVAWENGF